MITVTDGLDVAAARDVLGCKPLTTSLSVQPRCGCLKDHSIPGPHDTVIHFGPDAGGDQFFMKPYSSDLAAAGEVLYAMLRDWTFYADHANHFYVVFEHRRLKTRPIRRWARARAVRAAATSDSLAEAICQAAVNAAGLAKGLPGEILE